MFHGFDVQLATEYGILEAILLNHLYFWIEKNRANGLHFHDGFTWTYNSTRAFSELFPYASARKINYALKHLQDEGLIQTGNYNTVSYDHTLWYAFTEKGISILQNCNFDFTKSHNRSVENVKPIPDIKPDIKPYINTDNREKMKIPNNQLLSEGGGVKLPRFVPPSVDEVKEYCKLRGNSIDAEHFVNYYQQSGWKLSTGVAMKDWKAAVRNWEQKPWNKTKKQNHELDGVF